MPRRSRSRRGGKDKKKRRGHSRSRSEESSRAPEGEPYVLELIPGRGMDAWPVLNIEVEDGDKVIPHVAARPGEEYLLRVRNNSRRHIACAVAIDGENALLKDGSLIVAPGDRRELPGFLVSKNFRGKEYVKEYKNFLFSKPKVVEKGDSTDPGETTYSTYGCITCEVFEAVCDEEADSDDEMHGQSTHYRGAGLHGSFDDRVVPEGKKTHLLYSAVTAQGSRQHIANSVRGRWWVRGPRKMTSLELRYKEAHSLMLLGVPAGDLGIVPVKDEGEDDMKKEEKKEEFEKPMPFSTKIECCDLTEDGNEAWTEQEPPPQAPPVSIGEGDL